jgi:hypothetical protein
VNARSTGFGVIIPGRGKNARLRFYGRLSFRKGFLYRPTSKSHRLEIGGERRPIALVTASIVSQPCSTWLLRGSAVEQVLTKRRKHRIEAFERPGTMLMKSPLPMRSANHPKRPLSGTLSERTSVPKGSAE